MNDDTKEMLYKVGGMGDPNGRYPQPWVGLTGEEIKTICVENGWDSSWQSMRFSHAIEAKLKQKNGFAEENT